MTTGMTILSTLLGLSLAACSDAGTASVNARDSGGGGNTVDAAVGEPPAVDAGVFDAGAVPPGPGALTVQTYSSSATGTIDIQVNSHLVLGPTEAILVDSQFLVADAQAVADMITKSGRTLTTILLTHAHPDHYAGLQVLQAAFPNAAIVTTPAVLGDFQASAPGTLTYLQSILGDLVAGRLVTPAALATDAITLDGEPLKVLELPNPGESAHGAALVLPGGGLVSGDLLYNGVHLQEGECHSDGWKQNLSAIKAMGFTTFYPGHGKAPVGASVFDDDSAYITGTIPLLRAAEGTDAGSGDAGDPRVGVAVGEITAAFPSFESSFLVGFSASNFIDVNRCE